MILNARNIANTIRTGKTSTRLLLLLSTLLTAGLSWLADPQHLARVQNTLHGHAAIVGAINFAVLMWNLYHNAEAAANNTPATSSPADEDNTL